MYEFKGFDDWVPIFRGGKQTDSQGRNHDGDVLIDQAVATFNASKHEPPACIGHPVDNAPAWGWVEGLRKDAHKSGALLMAKFKQVQPEFAGMVKEGLFKKRSAAFYPDGRLRHVAFLGAAPPAVKGLSDIGFTGAPGPVFEFADYETVWAWETVSRMFGKMRDYLIEKEGVERADQVIDAYGITQILEASAKEKQEMGKAKDLEATPLANYKEKEDKGMDFKELTQKLKELIAGVDSTIPAPAPAGKTFSEADLAAQTKQAADAAAKAEREKVTAEFAEKEIVARHDARKKEIGVWCDTQVKAGKMTPAMVKFGVPEFMSAFAEKDDVIEFGESKEKATLYDRFKTFVETEMPKVVEFKEIATRDKDAGGQGGAGEKLASLVQQRMKDNKEITYSAAFSEVQRENPDLAREYAAEFNG